MWLEFGTMPMDMGFSIHGGGKIMGLLWWVRAIFHFQVWHLFLGRAVRTCCVFEDVLGGGICKGPSWVVHLIAAEPFASGCAHISAITPWESDRLRLGMLCFILIQFVLWSYKFFSSLLLRMNTVCVPQWCLDVLPLYAARSVMPLRTYVRFSSTFCMV